MAISQIKKKKNIVKHEYNFQIGFHTSSPSTKINKICLGEKCTEKSTTNILFKGYDFYGKFITNFLDPTFEIELESGSERGCFYIAICKYNTFNFCSFLNTFHYSFIKYGCVNFNHNNHYTFSLSYVFKNYTYCLKKEENKEIQFSKFYFGGLKFYANYYKENIDINFTNVNDSVFKESNGNNIKNNYSINAKSAPVVKFIGKELGLFHLNYSFYIKNFEQNTKNAYLTVNVYNDICNLSESNQDEDLENDDINCPENCEYCTTKEICLECSENFHEFRGKCVENCGPLCRDPNIIEGDNNVCICSPETCSSEYKAHFENDCVDICPEERKYNLTFNCTDQCNWEYPYVAENFTCVKTCKETGITPFYSPYLNKCLEICEEGQVPIDNICKKVDEGDFGVYDFFNQEEFDVKKFMVSAPLISVNDTYIQMFEYNQSNVVKKEGLSTIDLGECTEILKSIYQTEKLYIVSLDSLESEKSRKDVSYKIYSENNTQIDMKFCQGISVSVSSPININSPLLSIELGENFMKQGIDIYDPEDEFYNDFCMSPPINNTDLTISDRKKNILDKADLCDNGCLYHGINYTNMLVDCKCEIGKEKATNSDLYEKKQKTYEIILNQINYKLFRCYKKFLILGTFKNNIGFYFSGAIILTCIGASIAFLSNGIIKLNSMVERKFILNKLDGMEKIHNLQKWIKEVNKIRKKRNIKEINRLKKIIKSLEPNKGNPPLKGDKSEFQTSNKNDIIIKVKPNKNKIKEKEKEVSITKEINSLISNDNSKEQRLNYLSENFFDFTSLKMRKKSLNGTIWSKYIAKKNIEKKKIEQKIHNIKKNIYSPPLNCEENLEYPEYIYKKEKSKDELSYYEAIKLENRTFMKMLFTFFFARIELILLIFYRKPNSLFCISLSVYLTKLLVDFTLNALLYSDEMISRKYENDGVLDTYYSIVLSFLSNVICSFISSAIDKATNYEFVIGVLEEESHNEHKYYKSLSRHLNRIKIKLYFYIVFHFILIFICAYYITIFCSVYTKSQASLFSNYITGFILSFSITFLASIFFAVFRKASLAFKSKKFFALSLYIKEKL